MARFSEKQWTQRFPTEKAPHKEISSYFQRKLRKGRISGFRIYCKQLCKQSLITGFSVIASTSNLLRKAIKVLVFLGCMCGFLYQTSEFLELYRAYPTMVDIQIERPTEVDTPALSFCNTNRIRRKALCTEKPEDCSFFKNRTEMCAILPKYCIPWEPPTKAALGIPVLRAFDGKNRSREYVQKLGESLKDFMAGCSVKAKVLSRCKNLVNVSWVDSEGFPYNCFTVESLWGLPEAQMQKIPIIGKISLMLKPQPEKYLLYFDLVLVHILLHEAHSLGNPFLEGITMESGKSYNVFVNQRVTERLPAPYQTNCTDYLKLWKKNGGYGPLTGKACAEQCKMENMLKTNGCVAQSISYPGNYTICEDEVFNIGSKNEVTEMDSTSCNGLFLLIGTYPSDDIIKKCSLQCKDACNEVSYSIRHEVAYDQTKKCGKDENCMYKDIYLHFIFNRMEVEKVVHQPRYENVEMFSYIGGYMGMWLGLSLVALFDFVETLMALVTYMCRNKRKKKTVHRY